MEVCQMSISGAFDHSRTSKKTALGKKKERFSRKTSHLFWRTRARERVHIIHRSRQNEWEHGRRERQFCRESWFGAGTRFASERTRAFFECGLPFFSPPPSASSSFSLLCAWRLSSSSVLHFFSSYDDSLYIVVSKESLRERRASTRIFKGRGEACLFFLRRSFVVYVVVVTEEEKC